MLDRELDSRVRLRAFEFLKEQMHIFGDVLPRKILQTGFGFEGQRVPLVGPQGIFKPAALEVPLTITTAPIVEGKKRPYDDSLGEDGFLRYRYRGSDPNHRDNIGLRLAMMHRLPLVYLYGIVEGEYLPRWPVYVVGEDPGQRTFTVAVDEAEAMLADAQPLSDTAVHTRRVYATKETQQRVHQAVFHRRVLLAYHERCAVCRLHHRKLIDAAHILPDKHPRGEPVVTNGLALCKLHHAAFDGDIMGIRPDLKVELRLDLLREADGPMLEHGLKDFQGSLIHVPHSPRLRPDPSFLEERYEIFRKAS